MDIDFTHNYYSTILYSFASYITIIYVLALYSYTFLSHSLRLDIGNVHNNNYYVQFHVLNNAAMTLIMDIHFLQIHCFV